MRKKCHLLWHEVLLLKVPYVENRGVVVVESDVNVENCHEFIELYIWLWYEVSIFLLLSLEDRLVTCDFLDNLEVDLKFDQGNSC